MAAREFAQARHAWLRDLPRRAPDAEAGGALPTRTMVEWRIGRRTDSVERLAPVLLRLPAVPGPQPADVGGIWRRRRQVRQLPERDAGEDPPEFAENDGERQPLQDDVVKGPDQSLLVRPKADQRKAQQGSLAQVNARIEQLKTTVGE